MRKEVKGLAYQLVARFQRAPGMAVAKVLRVDVCNIDLGKGGAKDQGWSPYYF